MCETPHPRLATTEDFLSKADATLRPYLEIYPVDVRYDEELLAAFWMATRLISDVVSRPTFTQVILGTSPFSVSIGHHRLIFEQSDTAAATTWKGLVFLNVQALSQSTLVMKTAAILEEFAHSMMGIADEPLVRTVVSHIFDAVEATPTGYRERD